MGTRRPNIVQWVWYAYGGKLPLRYAEWVLHDATCRTWVLRHFARAFAQLAPLCALLMFLPGPLEIRLMSIVLGLFVGLFYSACFMGETVEHRVIKHGHQPGIARETREMYREVRRATREASGKRQWWE